MEIELTTQIELASRSAMPAAEPPAPPSPPSARAPTSASATTTTTDPSPAPARRATPGGSRRGARRDALRRGPAAARRARLAREPASRCAGDELRLLAADRRGAEDERVGADLLDDLHLGRDPVRARARATPAGRRRRGRPAAGRSRERTASGSARVDAAERHGAVRAERDREEVHRGRADEAGDERVRRPLVEHARRVALLQPPVSQHRDAVAERHRLGLVVRDVDGRDPEVATGAPRCRRASARAASRRGSRAARPSGRPSARGRSRGPSPRAAAGRRRAAPACGAGTRSRPSSSATSRTRALARRLLHARDPQREADVRLHREIRIERVVLEDHRDVAVLRRRRRSRRGRR